MKRRPQSYSWVCEPGGDLTIEAVFEDLTVGQEVLAGLEADAVIATNTSYLDIDRMSEGLSRPERILGLHFLSAADAMKLPENGMALRSSDVDVAIVIGYGFPRWRGGPLYWAARQDGARLEADLAMLAQAVGHGYPAGPVAEVVQQIETPARG